MAKYRVTTNHGTIDADQWFPGNAKLNKKYSVEEWGPPNAKYGKCLKSDTPTIEPGDYLSLDDAGRTVVIKEALFERKYVKAE